MALNQNVHARYLKSHFFIPEIQEIQIYPRLNGTLRLINVKIITCKRQSDVSVTIITDFVVQHLNN